MYPFLYLNSFQSFKNRIASRSQIYVIKKLRKYAHYRPLKDYRIKLKFSKD